MPEPTTTHQRKLRIAIACEPIADQIAGSIVSTLRFARLLQDRGHTVIFIAAKTQKNPKSNTAEGFTFYRFFGLPVPRTDKQFYITFPAIRSLKKILVKEKIDVVHTILPTPATVIAIRAAKALKIKVVAHSHSQPENLFMHMPKLFAGQTFNKLFYRYLNWIYKQADVVIYPTEFAKHLFADVNANVRTEVISNGVDISHFKAVDPEPFLAKYAIPHDVRKVLFVGRLSPEKCIDTIIRATPSLRKLYPKTQIIIVGFGPVEGELKKLTADLHVEDAITFTGKIANEDLVQAYSACDIFVLPSLAELEGMVVLEAIACGKPIAIANAKDSAATYFVKDNGILFTPEDPEDLATKLAPVLKDDALRRHMAEVSTGMRPRIDINNSVTQLEQLYYSVLGMHD